jgi:creatinine amidohydrolase
MKLKPAILAMLITLPFAVFGQGQANAVRKGILLEDLTWLEAEKILTPSTVVVIPLGAAAKEHGPHLKLKNDFIMAEYLKRRVLRQADVVVVPTLNYHFYPAFVEYPGSTSLRLETARDAVIDICKSLARFGPRRFYVLNTGISTLRALKPAAEQLAPDGILVRYTDLRILAEVEKTISKQEGGTHADEVETSIMLYIAPESVEMKKAAKDYNGNSARGGLTRDPKKEGVYSPSGVWGDPTLATRGKGKILTEALVSGILKEIEEFRQTPLTVSAKP